MRKQANHQSFPSRRKVKQIAEQTNKPSLLPQRPTSPDKNDWEAYWKAIGQPWRTEPEIDEKRQKVLTNCLSTMSDTKNNIYPFKGMRLKRADVEWLLVMHGHRRVQMVDWKGKKHWRYEGLDLRGANLYTEDLSYLPLDRMIGGLYWNNPPIISSLDECRVGTRRGT